MKIIGSGPHLTATEIIEWNAANATAIRDELIAALPAWVTRLDIDLSATTFIDSSGIGAMLALRRHATELGTTIALKNPRPHIRKLLELMQLQRMFEITNS